MSYKTPRKLIGWLCLFPAAIMFLCGFIIWPAIDHDNYGWPNMLLSAVVFATGVCYAFMAIAIWWPERHQRFWRWWRGD